MQLIVLLLACSEPGPKALPSRIMQGNPDTRMVKFSDVTGYLLKDSNHSGVIMVVDSLTEKYKKCAKKRLTPGTTALLIDRQADQGAARLYLETQVGKKVEVIEIKCEEGR